MSRRALVVCPGRGSYTAEDLGSLRKWSETPMRDAAREMVARADAYRTSVGSPTIAALDDAPKYQASLHSPGENAGPLTYTCTATDWLGLPRQEFEPVAVVGNSMGWYTALVVAGVLDFGDGLVVSDTMSKSHRGGTVGGQIIYPVVDDEWRPDATAVGLVKDALSGVTAEGHLVAESIRLGGFVVLAGDDAGLVALKGRLPAVKFGKRDYPFQLAGHSAFHTALMTEHSRVGTERLSGLAWRTPRLSLVDGRGHVARPGIARVADLVHYTFVDQVLTTYDFTLSLRVALREFAPDVIVLLGPGDTLGGAIGQTLVREVWQGIDCKAAFARRQAGPHPILVAMGRAADFERWVRPFLA